MSEKDGQCNHRIWKGFYSHRCTRNDWKDGFCKQHHPDSVKKRREDADGRLQAKLAEDSALQDKKRRQSEENAQLRRENERLREALVRFGRHQKECDAYRGCVCGLDAALQGETAIWSARHDPRE